jgi:RimJ/RimL family protein N-acetyltransferase
MTRHELRTPRLALRAWRDDDLEPFAVMNADPEVMRWFPATMTREQSAASIERFDAHHTAHGFTAWVVEVVESERGACPFVGFVGLVTPTFDPPFAHRDPCVEIGYRLARPWWGLGIATEAARSAVEFGFGPASLEEIVSFTVPANIRSQAVMQRLGMHYDGVFPHPRAQAGEWWGPHVLYRMAAPSTPTDPSGRTQP